MATTRYPAVSTHTPASRSARLLWVYGAAMLIPLAYFAWRYPLRGNIELNDLGGMSHLGRAEFWGYNLGIASLFVLYALALLESRRLSVREALPPVFGCGALFALVMALMYPVTAIDIFNYYIWSRIYTTHGANSMESVARDFPGDPLMVFAGGGWDGHPSPYGPLWNLLAAPITAVSGDRVGLALAGFKLVAILSLLAGGLVVALILARLRPRDAATGAMFYLWNPLLLWEIAGNGHNDTVMTLLILLAFLAWVRRWHVWVIPLLVASAMVKYASFLLVPLAAIALWRRAGDWRERLRLFGVSAALSLGVALISMYPFYDPGAIRHSLSEQSKVFLISPANVAIGYLQDSYPVADLERWAKNIGGAILLVALTVAGSAVWKRPSRLARASFEVFYVFLLVVTWYFQGWYLAWPLALGALLPWGWPAWRMIAWTAGYMSVYALFIWLRRWLEIDPTVILRYGVLMISGATALLTLVEIVAHLTSRHRTSGEVAGDRALRPEGLSVEG